MQERAEERNDFTRVNVQSAADGLAVDLRFGAVVSLGRSVGGHGGQVLQPEIAALDCFRRYAAARVSMMIGAYGRFGRR